MNSLPIQKLRMNKNNNNNNNEQKKNWKSWYQNQARTINEHSIFSVLMLEAINVNCFSKVATKNETAEMVTKMLSWCRKQQHQFVVTNCRQPLEEVVRRWGFFLRGNGFVFNAIHRWFYDIPYIESQHNHTMHWY